ncbi:MAG: Stp1/IreP family PP2C-type Ser/Thr phosphatase [Coriobacteriia bacterium]
MTPRAKPSWAALSDIGRVRTHNEDSVLAQPPLFVVADGMGGHEAGEVASSIAIETIRDHAPRRPDAKALARAVKAANREVIRSAREGYGKQGMGTTMTAAIVEGTHIAIAHVGDSRAYLLRSGTLEQITDDHSMVADMIRRGQLTEAEARYHPNRSVITRALGTDPSVVADTYELTAGLGDRLMLCSDGLTGMLEDAMIAETLATYADPAAATRALVDAANDAGGHDNISVVVIDIGGEGAVRGATVDPSGARRGRGWLALLGWLLLFALIVGGVVFSAYHVANSRAYLIAENGVVVIYQGVPGSFAGITLSTRAEQSSVAIADLDLALQSRLKLGLPMPSLQEAQQAVEGYRQTIADKKAPVTIPSTSSPDAAPSAP